MSGLLDRLNQRATSFLPDGGPRYVRWRCRRAHWGLVDRLSIHLGIPQRCSTCAAAGIVSDLRPIDPAVDR